MMIVDEKVQGFVLDVENDESRHDMEETHQTEEKRMVVEMGNNHGLFEEKWR